MLEQSMHARPTFRQRWESDFHHNINPYNSEIVFSYLKSS